MNENEWRSHMADILSQNKLDHVADQEDCHDIRFDNARFYFSVITHFDKPQLQYQVSMELDDTRERDEVDLLLYTLYSKRADSEDWNILDSDQYELI